LYIDGKIQHPNDKLTQYEEISVFINFPRPPEC
jgi:hypothetical protein